MATGDVMKRLEAMTLLGMSGAGKTYFSQMLEEWGWAHYSCDFEIARLLGIEVQIDDLSALSRFIGQVGNPDLGGVPLDEFKRRQKLYYDAECQALQDVGDAIARNVGTSFVNDSTGSFCEITDEAIIQDVAERTLLVYIETDPADHGEIIDRAKSYPKPLYFPADRFDGWLDEYCAAQGVSVETLIPNDFSAWVFPKLFHSRLPKYERLAREYGVTIAANDLRGVTNVDSFLRLVDEQQ